MHVLVVDDIEFNRRIAEHILLSLGCKVDIAENGAEALDKVSGSHYDMIFMDIQMPDMSGMEVTRIIRSIKRGKELIIIAMSADGTKEDRAKYLKSGMVGFISKPLTESAVKKILVKYAKKAI